MRKFMFFLVLGAIGCKKYDVVIKPVASLNVANVVIGGKTVKLNSNTADSATTFNYKLFAILAGNNSVYLYPSGDSIHPYFSRTVQVGAGNLFSVFLAGSTGTQIDTIFVQDKVSRFNDSSCGIRFVNLCYNSSPIIVTQSGTPTVVDFPSMPYKQLSAFKTFPALSVNGTYSFQIRDAGTNVVLATYALATPRFFNCTLIWKGLQGGTGTNVPGILRMNNY